MREPAKVWKAKVPGRGRSTSFNSIVALDMASCYLPASEQAEVETAESKVTYSVPAGSTALLGMYLLARVSICYWSWWNYVKESCLCLYLWCYRSSWYSGEIGAAASAPSTLASPAWVSLTDLNHETQNHAHEAISIPNREKEGTLGEVASFVRLGWRLCVRLCYLYWCGWCLCTNWNWNGGNHLYLWCLGW